MNADPNRTKTAANATAGLSAPMMLMLRSLGLGVLALLATVVLQVSSIVSLNRMRAAITATRPELLAGGSQFGEVIPVVRILAIVFVVGAVTFIYVRKRMLPLGDVLDRILIAIVVSSLGTLLVELAVGSIVAGRLRTLRWGVGDLPLVLLDILLSAVVLAMAVQRTRWLTRVRLGQDAKWSIEPVRSRIDEQRDLLAEQREGNGILLRLVVGERAPWEKEAPVTAIPVARLDYVDEQRPWQRHRLRGGLLLVSAIFGSALAAGLTLMSAQPPVEWPLAAGTDAATITSLAVPEDAPSTAPLASGSAASAPGDITAASSEPRIVKDGSAMVVSGALFRTNVLQLSGDGSCLRDVDGQIYCRKLDTPGYVQVKGIIAATFMASRGLRGCAILPGGGVRCWRDPSDDPMVPLHGSAESHPVENLPPQMTIAVGDTFACGVSFDKQTRCWEPGGIPYPVDNVVEAQTIAIAATHACAIQKDNTVACWGSSDYGATPSTSVAHTLGAARATAIPGVANVAQLALGATHSCARMPDGTVKCWGFLTSDSWDRGVRSVPLAPSRMIAASDGIVCSLESDKIACLGDR